MRRGCLRFSALLLSTALAFFAGRESALRALKSEELAVAHRALTVIGPDYQKGKAAYDAGKYAEALRVFKPLAEQGNADAQLYLAGMYARGESVPQDEKEAARWVRLAAEKGNADAQWQQGYRYETGDGVPQDYKEALKWFRLAAEQGHAGAQEVLSDMYDSGEGVPQDAPTAYMWINLAVTGNSLFANDRDKLAQRMTPSQIEKGQDLTRACVAKNYKGC